MPEMSACTGKSSRRRRATCHSNTNIAQTMRRYSNYSKVAEKAVLKLLQVELYNVFFCLFKLELFSDVAVSDKTTYNLQFVFIYSKRMTTTSLCFNHHVRNMKGRCVCLSFRQPLKGIAQVFQLTGRVANLLSVLTAHNR